jgi:hypothetical protein
MMDAQLYGSHAASMECYRRAMLPGQSIEAKQINLTLAAKLTKANATQSKHSRSTGARASRKSLLSMSVSIRAARRLSVKSPRGLGKKYGGSTPCSWICRKRPGAGQRPEGASLASLRECLTAGAECTAGLRLEPLRAIRTLSSMVAILRGTSRKGGRVRR